jgi:hypothetical protein
MIFNHLETTKKQWRLLASCIGSSSGGNPGGWQVLEKPENFGNYTLFHNNEGL